MLWKKYFLTLRLLLLNSRFDTDTWYSDEFDSDDSESPTEMTYDDAGPASSSRRSSAEPGRPMQKRKRSNLGADASPQKVLRITTDAQLNTLCREDLNRLLGPTMRLKPRKAVHPSISVVF